jgi:tRNA(adenine34) deaminase
MDHTHFMTKALEEAMRALNKGEFPVGCVVGYQNNILVTGTRRGTGRSEPNELDHAEMVALRRLVDLKKRVERQKVVVYSTLEPCLMCYSALIVNGIRNIVYACEDVMGGGMGLDLTRLNPLYSNMKIHISGGIMRKESLALLKAFFSDSRHGYLRGTLLAQHALKA